MKDLIRRRKPAGGDTRKKPPTGSPGPEVAKSRINPTVSADAIAEAQNALDAAHTTGDYRYQSIGDVIRAALAAYATGLDLVQQAKSGRKKRHTVELSPELFAHYQKLPSRSRGVIVERALLSFLAQGLGKSLRPSSRND